MTPNNTGSEILRIFPELSAYTLHGQFVFTPVDRLSIVCNAPPDQSGIYLVYGRGKQETTLLYVGTSGGKGINGNILHRKGGMRYRIISGRQFGGRRTATWPSKMKESTLDALDIYWYVTWDMDRRDFPKEIATLILKKHRQQKGSLPEWNVEG